MRTPGGCVEVEGRAIGGGARCFLVAELSANHDRDLGQALALVDLAADCGWDAVKLQTYSADSLTVRSSHPSGVVDPIWGAANLHDLYSQAAMPAEFHKPLFERARARGLLPFTTLYDPRDLSFTEELGNPIYKIASFELTHYELLAEVAGTGKPVILSTGMSDLAEIEEALGVLDKHEAGPVVLMHCCSAYPAEPAEANLNAIATMKAAFQLPVGYSDHTVGPHIPLAAVMRGACVIEKHVTNDVHRRGPDHRFSADAATMTQMVRFIRESEAALGSGRKTAQPSEMINRAAGRRSIFVVKDIKAGQRIDRDCLRVVRPGAGLHPRYLGRMLGGRAARDLKAGSPLEWDDIVCR